MNKPTITFQHPRIKTLEIENGKISILVAWGNDEIRTRAKPEFVGDVIMESLRKLYKKKYERYHFSAPPTNYTKNYKTSSGMKYSKIASNHKKFIPSELLVKEHSRILESNTRKAKKYRKLLVFLQKQVDNNNENAMDHLLSWYT